MSRLFVSLKKIRVYDKWRVHDLVLVFSPSSRKPPSLGLVVGLCVYTIHLLVSLLLQRSRPCWDQLVSFSIRGRLSLHSVSSRGKIPHLNSPRLFYHTAHTVREGYWFCPLFLRRSQWRVVRSYTWLSDPVVWCLILRCDCTSCSDIAPGRLGCFTAVSRCVSDTLSESNGFSMVSVWRNVWNFYSIHIDRSGHKIRFCGFSIPQVIIVATLYW